jgi:hypothetical protein
MVGVNNGGEAILLLSQIVGTKLVPLALLCLLQDKGKDACL